MKYYTAPLEGITGYVFRKIHHKYYPGADKYFIPFIEPKPNSKKVFNSRELNDILPEHNEGIYAVPQILTNKYEDFLWTVNHIREYGYQEVNINLGCPSKTVVTKGRGAGFLKTPEKIDEFLYQVFEKTDMEISVKTRLGMETAEEFEELLSIYNKYPLKELIIHPRTGVQLYGGAPDLYAYEKAVKRTTIPVCYNGDVNSVEDMEAFGKCFLDTDAVMMGRGILRNPGLIDECRGGRMTSREHLMEYHGELLEAYRETMPGETPALMKMKELWCYLCDLFEYTEKEKKAVAKAKNLKEFEAASGHMLRTCEIKRRKDGIADNEYFKRKGME